MQPEEVLVNRLFFPSQQCDDLRRLFNFVDTTRQYVQNPVLLNKLARLWQKYGDRPIRDLEIISSDGYDVQAIKRMGRIKIIYGLDIAWVDSLLVAALDDVKPQKFSQLSDTLHYAYGSAEVVGLMTARLLRLPKEAQPLASAQARALQWMVFMRNMAADAERGYCYFPQADLKMLGLKDLSAQTAKAEPQKFKQFIDLQLKRYWQWQNEAKDLNKFLDRRQRAALSAIIDTTNQTALRLARDPQEVYSKNLTSPKRRLVLLALAHMFD